LHEEVKILNDTQKKEEIKSSEPVKIDFKDGINVKYERENLKKIYPHLMEEIENKDKLININSVTSDIENISDPKLPQKNKPQIPNELINPGVSDFIRRCKNEKEAFEILDYLLKRKEITQLEHDEFKTKINQVNGLKDLIEECGGFKKPGYYEKKYYKKNINK